MSRKIFITIALLGIIFTTFIYAAWSGAFTPSAPAGWTQIHLGMKRDEVLKLAGTPTFSGWPENIWERWRRDGMICHHWLEISYDGEQVSYVCEGTWLRGYGWLYPRRELK
ncbi:MAG TPA: hypothetical protein VG347_21125 [Verrucomicrobiae bacterium]|nr:hypothetical protein [Verrucomicrobiae bacterium]